jgi:hypothetical protein
MHDLPAAPPPEALADVDAAWERAQELFAGELELHFELDPLTRRVHGELRMPGADVAWERLSAREALALACGDAIAVPAGEAVAA